VETFAQLVIVINDQNAAQNLIPLLEA
jgi:hypothetical protein